MLIHVHNQINFVLKKAFGYICRAIPEHDLRNLRNLCYANKSFSVSIKLTTVWLLIT